MNLQNYFWYFKKAVPDHICDDIIKYGLQIKEEMAVTGGYGDQKLNQREIKDLKKKRDSNIVWLSESWIYKELHPYIRQANTNAGWNFQWDFSEACQFTKYNKGQYYDWHCDSWERSYNKPNDPQSHGKIRKLSVTLSLSDNKDYKGGELEFDLRNIDPDKKRNTMVCKEIRPKGSMVVFPSFLWHRVRPVTKGSRYSLVIWNLGWPFK
jgi:PKHD-type hydroxylase